jgi:hypothetical protein
MKHMMHVIVVRDDYRELPISHGFVIAWHRMYRVEYLPYLC